MKINLMRTASATITACTMWYIYKYMKWEEENTSIDDKIRVQIVLFLLND